MRSIPILFLLVATTALSGVAADRPNILFAISDDQSFPHAGAYGTSWVKTPAFDRVAAEGLLFMNCYTPNAKCAPSRSCIGTGRNSWQLEEAGNHWSYFPKKFTTFSEAFVAAGIYAVGSTGKGIAPVRFRDGNRQLTGKSWNKRKAKPPAGGISNNDYAANFKDFLDAKPKDKPFLFWYGSTEPHRGFQFGAGIKHGGKSLNQIDKVPAFWPDNETVRTDMLDYAFEIEHFDNHLGRMLQHLEAAGELNNTLIVVTSDNGMAFPRAKGAQYELSNHMPLAVMWPKGITNPGRKITDYVSFIDFAPTFLDVAGIAQGATTMQPIQGQSLTPIFKSPKSGRVIPERDHVLLGQERHDVGRPDDVGYPIRSIVKDGLLYVHNFEPDRWPMCNPETGYLNTDGSPTKTEVLNLRRQGKDTKFWDLCFAKRGSEELYDLKKDPDCVNNLMANPEYSPKAAALKQQLFAALKKQKDPRMFGNGAVFDNYPYSGAQRDFYNRFISGEIKSYITGWVNKSDYETEPIE